MSRLVLDSDMLIAQLTPHDHDFCKPFGGAVPLHNACRHDRDILCNQPRIETVVLRQNSASASELTKLVWIDPSYRQTRHEQRANDASFVAAAGLDADAVIDRPRSRSIISAQPATLLSTEKHCRMGSTITSKRSFDTSIPL